MIHFFYNSFFEEFLFTWYNLKTTNRKLTIFFLIEQGLRKIDPLLSWGLFEFIYLLFCFYWLANFASFQQNNIFADK